MIVFAEVKMVYDSESTPWAGSYYPLGLIIQSLRKVADELEASAMREVEDEDPYPLVLEFPQDTDGLVTGMKVTRHGSL